MKFKELLELKEPKGTTKEDVADLMLSMDRETKKYLDSLQKKIVTIFNPEDVDKTQILAMINKMMDKNLK